MYEVLLHNISKHLHSKSVIMNINQPKHDMNIKMNINQPKVHCLITIFMRKQIFYTNNYSLHIL